jgi:DNA-directed RNA polymerase subunit omega
MRLERYVAEALKRLKNDRYLLTVAVAQRANDLSAGAKPLIDNVNLKKDKFSDIAIKEIAQGLLIISEER